MTRFRRGTLVRGVLGGLLASICLAGAADSATPTLVDPITGQRVPVEAAGSVLHVVFFATWCPECLAELDLLEELEARWTDSGYRILIVAVNTRQSAEWLAQIAKARRFPGRLVIDQDGTLERAWKVTDLPTHVVLDGTGNELVRRTAADAELVQAIDRALAARRRK